MLENTSAVVRETLIGLFSLVGNYCVFLINTNYRKYDHCRVSEFCFHKMHKCFLGLMRKKERKQPRSLFVNLSVDISLSFPHFLSRSVANGYVSARASPGLLSVSNGNSMGKVVPAKSPPPSSTQMVNSRKPDLRVITSQSSKGLMQLVSTSIFLYRRLDGSNIIKSQSCSMLQLNDNK